MFFSTPIDLDKWNAAEWRGMLYLFYPGAVPVLGLLYRNYAAAKSIFTDWKKTAISINRLSIESAIIFVQYFRQI